MGGKINNLKAATRTLRPWHVSRNRIWTRRHAVIDTQMLETKFARIGARIKVPHTERIPSWRAPTEGRVRLDVKSDARGEYFEVASRAEGRADVEVLDIQPGRRHLLLLVRDQGEKSKFLCGHDERHWFVAAVPEKASVGSVRSAMEALKPREVQDAQARVGLGSKARERRKNAAYRRQGEWFFVPEPRLNVDPRLVLQNEPITRSNGSKPHQVEFCYRTGGQTVYVSWKHPAGLDEEAYRKLIDSDSEASRWNWRVFRRDAAVYARGRVRHADHKTITLSGWHRVYMNTESQAVAMRNVAFLD
jgi:hypothetical protein